MLASLTIRNFVLIEDATLEFGDGLTALTGETGAGKTLLTKALGLLMGERAEEGMVGAAGDEALIQALFDLDAGQVAQLPVELRELAGLDGPGELILTRRLGKTGRNRCYLNDSSVTLTSMAAVAGALLSFAGQHEYRRLLDPGYQLAVLDQWAGADALDLAAAYRRGVRTGAGKRPSSGGEPAGAEPAASRHRVAALSDRRVGRGRALAPMTKERFRPSSAV